MFYNMATKVFALLLLLSAVTQALPAGPVKRSPMVSEMIERDDDPGGEYSNTSTCKRGVMVKREVPEPDLVPGYTNKSKC